MKKNISLFFIFGLVFFFYPDTSFAVNHNMENKVLEDKSVENFDHEYIQIHLGESIDVSNYIDQKFADQDSDTSNQYVVVNKDLKEQNINIYTPEIGGWDTLYIKKIQEGSSEIIKIPIFIEDKSHHLIVSDQKQLIYIEGEDSKYNLEQIENDVGQLVQDRQIYKVSIHDDGSVLYTDISEYIFNNLENFEITQKNHHIIVNLDHDDFIIIDDWVDDLNKALLSINRAQNNFSVGYLDQYSGWGNPMQKIKADYAFTPQYMPETKIIDCEGIKLYNNKSCNGTYLSEFQNTSNGSHKAIFTDKSTTPKSLTIGPIGMYDDNGESKPLDLKITVTPKASFQSDDNYISLTWKQFLSVNLNNSNSNINRTKGYDVIYEFLDSSQNKVVNIKGYMTFFPKIYNTSSVNNMKLYSLKDDHNPWIFFNKELSEKITYEADGNSILLNMNQLREQRDYKMMVLFDQGVFKYSIPETEGSLTIMSKNLAMSVEMPDPAGIDQTISKVTFDNQKSIFLEFQQFIPGNTPDDVVWEISLDPHLMMMADCSNAEVINMLNNTSQKLPKDSCRQDKIVFSKSLFDLNPGDLSGDINYYFQFKIPLSFPKSPINIENLDDAGYSKNNMDIQLITNQQVDSQIVHATTSINFKATLLADYQVDHQLVSFQNNPDDFYITHQVPELENPFLEWKGKRYIHKATSPEIIQYTEQQVTYFFDPVIFNLSVPEHIDFGTIHLDKEHLDKVSIQDTEERTIQVYANGPWNLSVQSSKLSSEKNSFFNNDQEYFSYLMDGQYYNIPLISDHQALIIDHSVFQTADNHTFTTLWNETTGPQFNAEDIASSIVPGNYHGTLYFSLSIGL